VQDSNLANSFLEERSEQEDMAAEQLPMQSKNKMDGSKESPIFIAMLATYFSNLLSTP
jgi:hypothetical protein